MARLRAADEAARSLERVLHSGSSFCEPGCLGKTGEEDKSVIGDRVPNFEAPILPRPQVGISPDTNIGSFEHLLEPVDLMRVLSNV